MSLAEKYGDPDVVAALHARDGWPDHDPGLTGGVEDLDDFSALPDHAQAGLDRPLRHAVLLRLRGRRPDQRAGPSASTIRSARKLNALFSSDIGHFDVPDMRDPLPEAYELVEHGLISADDFRDFMFANAVRLWGTQNPRLLQGHRGGQGRAPRS